MDDTFLQSQGFTKNQFMIAVGGWGRWRHSGPAQPKTLDKKTVQHNVDDDILTKQIFPGAQR